MGEKTIQIIRSRRRSIAIQILPDLQIVVRAPLRMSMRDIRAFVEEKSDWIEKHLELVRERTHLWEQSGTTQLSDAEIKGLAELAKRVIPERVAYYAPLVGVDFGRITIRHQKSRWGSCSSKGNLNFNCLLMKLSPELLDYVVVHELCHRKEMNHSPRFWAEVERVLPDYRELRRKLKESKIGQ